MWDFLWEFKATGDHPRETSYLKAHPFGNRYPEWPGFKPMHSGIPEPPDPALFYCAVLWLFSYLLNHCLNIADWVMQLHMNNVNNCILLKLILIFFTYYLFTHVLFFILLHIFNRTRLCWNRNNPWQHFQKEATYFLTTLWKEQISKGEREYQKPDLYWWKTCNMGAIHLSRWLWTGCIE